jgi:hypothetical protein
LRFGKTVGHELFPDLSSAISAGRPWRWNMAADKLKQAKQHFMNSAFANALSVRRDELIKLGVNFQGSKMNFSEVKEEDIEQTLAVLSNVLQKPYEREFQNMTDEMKQEFSYRLKSFVTAQIHCRTGKREAGSTIIEIAEQFLFEGAFWNTAVPLEEKQREYADIQYHEIHAPASLTALERRFGIDLRITGGDLSQSEAAVLGRVLEFIHGLLPVQLQRIPSITLVLQSYRAGGGTFLEEQGRIELYGPFGDPGGGGLPDYYSEAASDLFQKDVYNYLTYALMHELGHRQEDREVLAFYKNSLPNLSKLEIQELIAEDFCTFHLSGKKEVPRRFANRSEIGQDTARLQFWRKRFP